jgi:predicted metal-dependent hydrolase
VKNREIKQNKEYPFSPHGGREWEAPRALPLEGATRAPVIDYRVIRSRKRRRTLVLTIERDGRVVIRVPYHTPEREIETFFRAKSAWVKKKIDEKKNRIENAEHPKQFVPGEKFLYLGEHYPFELREPGTGRGRLALSHGTFFLDSDGTAKARDIFIQWYKERAREIFTERVNFYSRQLRLYPREIRISSAKTRYGSCTADNKLFFSFRLVMAPYSKIDYVIVHELAHIKIKNHSQGFWRYVEEVMPEYRKHRKWLKDNSLLLDI